MRAVVVAAAGEPTAADRPEPVPGPREVVIETAAVGIGQPPGHHGFQPSLEVLGRPATQDLTPRPHFIAHDRNHARRRPSDRHHCHHAGSPTIQCRIPARSADRGGQAWIDTGLRYCLTAVCAGSAGVRAALCAGVTHFRCARRSVWRGGAVPCPCSGADGDRAAQHLAPPLRTISYWYGDACRVKSSAYVPLRASSSECVPDSTTDPSRNT